jgi:hypothetical protein
MKRPAYPPVSYEPHYHQAHEGYPPDMQQQPELKAGRRRRGNLPKETTDKLRGWFMAHLHHPYPTEDQKQDLMLQTGLQMSEYLLQKCPQNSDELTIGRPNLELVH